MSKRYWFTATALGLVVIIGLTLWGWEEFRLYQSEHTDQRQDAAQYETKASTENIHRCIEIGSFAICYGKTVQPETGEKYTKYDLRAQQDMAEWTYALLLFTVAGTIVGITGLAALFWSLWQTRTVINDTREIGEKQVRAYLAYDGSFLSPTKRDFVFIFHNYGSTPAFSANIFVEYAVAAADSEETDIAWHQHFYLEPMTIAPNQPMKRMCDIGDSNTDLLRKFERENVWFYARLALQYRDIFDVIHETEYFLSSETSQLANPITDDRGPRHGIGVISMRERAED